VIDKIVNESGWYTPRNDVRKDLDRDLMVKYAVIGGGINGVSAAYRLAQLGHEPILLEADEIGSGGTGASNAIITTTSGSEESAVELLRIFGEIKTKRLYDSVGKGVSFIRSIIEREKIDCVYGLPGYLCLFDNEDEAMNEMRVQDIFGNKSILVHNNSLKKFIDGDYYKAGLFFSDSDKNFVIDPLKFIREMANISERIGTDIYENSKVVIIRENNRNVSLFLQNGREITTEKVIVSTNPYTLGLKGLPLSVKKRGVPICQYLSLLEFADYTPVRNCGGFADEEDIAYMFGNVNGRKMMVSSGNFEFIASREPSELNINIEANLDVVRKRFGRDDFSLIKSWAGKIGGSPTKGFLPQTGFYDEREKVYIGFFGDGLPIGCYLGLTAANVVSNNGEVPKDYNLQRNDSLLLELAGIAPAWAIDRFGKKFL